MPSFIKLFQKNQRAGNTSQLILPGGITLIPKSDKYTTRKENYRPIYMMNTDAKLLNKILLIITESDNT